MKRAELEKLARDIEDIGYEILKIKPIELFFSNRPRKAVPCAYSLEIAPIKECEEDRKLRGVC